MRSSPLGRSGSCCLTTERSKRRAIRPNRAMASPRLVSKKRCSADRPSRLAAASKRSMAALAAARDSSRWTSTQVDDSPSSTAGVTTGSKAKATAAMWAWNAAAIETAKSAAGSRAASRVRLTTRSLIMADLPDCGGRRTLPKGCGPFELGHAHVSRRADQLRSSTPPQALDSASTAGAGRAGPPRCAWP